MKDRHPWLELRAFREKNGDSLTSLASRTKLPGREKEMSLSYLSQLESGDREPNAQVTKALADALKVPVSVLEKSVPTQPAATA